MTMSMMEQRGPNNNEVMNSTLRWKDRPHRWRKDKNDKDIVADYQQRYSVDDAKRTGLMQKTASMGPFYEKYIKKMG